MRKAKTMATERNVFSYITVVYGYITRLVKCYSVIQGNSLPYI